MYRYRHFIAGAVAAGFTYGALFLTHQMGRLPQEPVLGSPAAMFSNWGFVIGFGMGLPYPKWSAGLILLGLTLLVYAGVLRLQRRRSLK